MDTATSTPGVVEQQATSTPLAPELEPPEPPELEAANDNPQPLGAEQSSHDGNSAVEPLPATGTE